MDDKLLRMLLEKESRCRTLQRQARTAFEKNGNRPCDEQCRYLQQAADLEFEMSTQTAGSERDHHIREKNRLDYEIMKIRGELDSAGKTAAPAAGKGGKAAPAASGAAAGSGDSGKTKEEEELARIAATWYKDAPRHSFEDVSGMGDLKNKLKGCIADAKAQDLMAYLKIPRLNTYFFVGPPGCGKTYIIEAFAHELMDKDYKFMSILGSDIISKYVGMAEKSVTKLFEEVEKSAPCILFIDEIDSLCKNRSLPNLPEYAANITTSFLTGYNRIHSSDADIIFIAATNYPNRVDAAMLDRAEVVRVPLPDVAAREAAFEKQFGGIITLKGITPADMARMTPHYNYRDIERLTSMVKHAVFKDVMELFKNPALAIEALQSGKYKLSRAKFEGFVQNFKPSPKEAILKDLKNWEIEMKTLVDFVETDVDALYECVEDLNLPGAPKKKAPAPSEPEIPEEPAEPEEADEPEIPEEPEAPAEPEMSDPVMAAQDVFVPDPLTQKVEIVFRTAEEHMGIRVSVDGMYYSVVEDGQLYSFEYDIAEGETEAEVFVSDENGFVGSFEAKFGDPIGSNGDFDI